MPWTITNITTGTVGINGEQIPPLSAGRKTSPTVTVEMQEFRTRGLINYSGYDDVVANNDNQRTIADAAYTLSPSDLGKVLRFTNASAVTVTLPGNMPSGFNCLWRQVGAGRITFTLAVTSPVQNLRNFEGLSKSAGQYAEGGLALDESGDWFLSGACGS